MDTEVTAALAAAYSHGPGKAVPPGAAPARARPAARGAGIPVAALTASGPFGAAVARTLRAALAPHRFEPWNAYNDHRAYPSPRATFAVDVALRAGADRWHVDPVREVLFGPAPAVAPGDGIRLDVRPVPDRLPANYGSLADALAHLEAGHVAAALVEAAAAHGLAVTSRSTVDGPPSTVELTVTAGAPRSAGIAPRSAGIAPRGLTADPRPLPAAALPALTRAAADPPPGSPARWPGPRHAVAVRNVAGFADGVYAVVGTDPRPRAAGNVMDEVQEAFTYPPSSVGTAGMNVAWVMTAPVAALVRAEGPAGYRRLLVTAGATAQHICTAAAAQGMFCRPCRSVREAALEAVVGAPADHDFVYLLLAGRSRLRDFPYDLRRP